MFISCVLYYQALALCSYITNILDFWQKKLQKNVCMPAKKVLYYVIDDLIDQKICTGCRAKCLEKITSVLKK